MRTRHSMQAAALAAVLAGTLLLAAAPVAIAQSPAPEPGLVGTTWSLTRIDGAPVAEAIGASLLLGPEMAGGSTGCNRFSAPYVLDGASLTFGGAAATMMLCEPPVMDVESAYLGALGTIAGWAITDGALTLSDASGAAALDYEAVTPAGLESTWAVMSYHDGNANVSVARGTDPQVTFSYDGTVSGTGGCNQFSGGYSIDGQTIAIGPLMSTLKLCADPAGSQDAHIQAALDMAATWSTDGRLVELRSADDIFLLSLAPLSGEVVIN